jgi:SecA-like APTase subunit of protein translocation complex
MSRSRLSTLKAVQVQPEVALCFGIDVERRIIFGGGGILGASSLEAGGREVTLAIIDEVWADYLANVAELQGGIHWFSRGGRDPLYEFLIGEREIYATFCDHVFEEIAKAVCHCRDSKWRAPVRELGPLRTWRDLDIYHQRPAWASESSNAY